MIRVRKCAFCGKPIPAGKGIMYVKKNGEVLRFCSSKCYKNMIVLGRLPRKVKRTEEYRKLKMIRLKGKKAASK